MLRNPSLVSRPQIHSLSRCACGRGGRPAYCTATFPIVSGFLFAEHEEEKEHEALKGGSDAEQVGKQRAEASHQPKYPAQPQQEEEKHAGCHLSHCQLPFRFHVTSYSITPENTLQYHAKHNQIGRHNHEYRG